MLLKKCFVHIILRLLSMVLTACPVFFLLDNFGIVHGVVLGFNTLVSQLFFDTITRTVARETGVATVLGTAAALGAASIGAQVINGIHNFLTKVFFKKTTGFLSLRINQKATAIDPISFESPAVLDNINKANRGMSNSMKLLFIT